MPKTELTNALPCLRQPREFIPSTATEFLLRRLARNLVKKAEQIRDIFRQI